ncbi:MAG: NDP-sugar synthase [Ignisphaera sp.]
MTEEIREAIILAGGDAWRLKPDIWIPKPLLKLNELTLLEYQLSWLIKHKFNHIIIASREKYPIKEGYEPYVEFSVEQEKKGTGGAVLIASDLLKTKIFYLMNVDDLLFGFNPNLLYYPDTEVKMVVAKPRLGFGRVELRQDLVLHFKEKPYLDFYVNAGHYLFKKHIVDKYFPEIGNLEDTVLPRLAEERKLFAHRFHGKWITINTYKDYMEAKDIVETLSKT